MNEGQELALMGLEKSLKILEDVIDVMAQIKRLMENEYDDESKTDQSSNFEGISSIDYSEKEVGIYACHDV
jgi:hypothetical protein